MNIVIYWYTLGQKKVYLGWNSIISTRLFPFLSFHCTFLLEFLFSFSPTSPLTASFKRDTVSLSSSTSFLQFNPIEFLVPLHWLVSTDTWSISLLLITIITESILLKIKPFYHINPRSILVTMVSKIYQSAAHAHDPFFHRKFNRKRNDLFATNLFFRFDFDRFLKDKGKGGCDGWAEERFGIALKYVRSVKNKREKEEMDLSDSDG